MLCKLCKETTERVFERRLLKKYNVGYWRCGNCEFTQTEEPYWLEEAYSSAVSDLDLGSVNRAVTGSKMVEGVILGGFDPNAKFVDWGGGYGVFTRLMRDLGYDFYWHDRYCENLFAKQFVASASSAYELMTAFEVFEHFVDPMGEIEGMLRLSPNVFFTTLIPPSQLTDATDWWYLALEHGQHVSIYSIRSLNFIAEKFGLHLSTDGTGTHLLSRTPFSSAKFKIITQQRKAAALMRRIGRRKLRTPSLLMQDFQAVTGWTL